MKAMLVDDDTFMLKVLSRQLADLGIVDLTCHESAISALGMLGMAARDTALIFCDLQMPDMDGVEFVRHLANMGYAGSLVFVSGEDERVLMTVEKLARAYRIDVLGALQKPVSPEQLRAMLQPRVAARQEDSRAVQKVYDVAELRRAIERGELVNHYQPKVDVKSGEVVGVETLVRWQHPDDGLVFPDRFIALAETNGLIDWLTRNVLTAALSQARRWCDAGLDLHVAVNVSMDSLGSLTFLDHLSRAAARERLPLDMLVLEVTESRLMSNLLASLEIFTRLRLKHVGLSIDDFGTGHSSLAQLRDVPFTELKIDQGFIHEGGRHAPLRAIVEASTRMARQLGMTTVVEGVEDREDWDFVRGLDCDLAQGYFIARPMPGERLMGWIDEWHQRWPELTRKAASATLEDENARKAN